LGKMGASLSRTFQFSRGVDVSVDIYAPWDEAERNP